MTTAAYGRAVAALPDFEVLARRRSWLPPFYAAADRVWRRLPCEARAVLSGRFPSHGLVSHIPPDGSCPGYQIYGRCVYGENTVYLAWPLAARLSDELLAALIGHEWSHAYLHRTGEPLDCRERAADYLAAEWGFAVHDLRRHLGAPRPAAMSPRHRVPSFRS
jgi:hypothetical protein